MTEVLAPSRPDTRSIQDPAVRRALFAGSLAGPVFVAGALVQGAARDGFSFTDHPPSALSLGTLGWIQTLSFIGSGAAIVAAAFGLRRTLTGAGHVWGPRLLGVFGAALAAAGVFPMDAAFGFPPGAPAGQPDDVSWHGALHGLSFFVGFGALVAASLVFAHRYHHQGRGGWQWASTVAGPLSLVLASVPNMADAEGQFVPLWLAVTITFTWTSAVINDVRSHGGDR